MLIVRIGEVVAWTLIIMGVTSVLMGIYVAQAYVDDAEFRAASRRYFGSKTSGEVIDRGLRWFVLGVGFGLLARIARRLG